MAPTSKHEARRDLLEAIAILAGYTLQVPAGLLGGREPDVVRFHPRHRSLFIGEAKDTESPLTTSSRIRLLVYMRWFAAEVTRNGSDGLFMLCVGSGMQAQQWCIGLSSLACEVGLGRVEVIVEYFGGGSSCVWFAFGGGNPKRLSVRL